MRTKNVIAMILTITGILLLTMLFLGMGGRGEEIIVDGGGGGDYVTIMEAVENSEDGDTILIEPGEYHEEVSIGKVVTVRGRDRSSVIIDSSGRGKCMEISENRTVISDLTLRNGDFGLYLDSAAECHFFNLSCENMDFEGVHLGYAMDTRIENLSVTNCTTGLQIFCSSGTDLVNVELRDNSNYQAFVYFSPDNRLDTFSAVNGSRGLFFFDSDNITLENGKISSNTEFGMACSSSVQNTIRNVTFSQNPQHDLNVDHGSVMAGFNLAARDADGMPVPLTYVVEKESTLTIHADLIVTVLNASGFPVPGVNASMKCQNSSECRTLDPSFINLTTDVNGTMRAGELHILTVNETSSTNITYLIELEKGLWRMSRSWEASSLEIETLVIENSLPVIGNISVDPLYGNESQIFTFLAECADESLASVSLFLGDEMFSLSKKESGFFSVSLSFGKGDHLFHVRASDGLDLIRSQSFGLRVFDDEPPGGIREVTFEDIGNGDLLVSWEESEAHDLSHYNVYLSPVNFSSVSNASEIMRVLENENESCIITDLVHGTEYYLAVTAVDDSGNEVMEVSPVLIWITHPPSAECDISITKFSISSLNPCSGENTSLFYEISNDGAGSIPEAVVTIFTDNETLFSRSHHGISPHENVSGTFFWTVPAGNHTISIRVECGNQSTLRSFGLRVRKQPGDQSESTGAGPFLTILIAMAVILLMVLTCRGIVVKRGKNILLIHKKNFPSIHKKNLPLDPQENLPLDPEEKT